MGRWAEAKQATTSIPIVLAMVGDADGIGLIDSLARPGGNVTGVTDQSVQLSTKRLEVLKDAIPKAARIAVLWNADDRGMTLRYQNVERAARELRVTVQALGTAFSAMTAHFALTHRIPAMYEYSSLVRDGGLMSYGADPDENYRRAATYVDRIFKGTAPGTLPVERPSRYYLTINLKTAKILGLTFPPPAAPARRPGDRVTGAPVVRLADGRHTAIPSGLVSRRPTQPAWVCLRAVLVLAAVVVIGGCAFDGPMSTLVAKSDLNRSILGVYKIITWATTIIGLLVFAVLAVVLLRYRERPGAPLPRQIHGHTAMEISWTIAPALILLIIAIPTIQVIFKTQSAASPKGALEVTVRGWQWWWEFRYPSLDVVTANEVHVPVGRPIVFVMEGPDVIHSLWIPQLGGKRDVVPGRVNRITLTPDTPGEYWGQCAEYCGASHANMMLRVIVEEPAAFDKWVAAQKAPAPEPAGDGVTGKEIFAKSACVGCHTIRGVSAGVLGPDLTHFGSRKLFGAGLWPTTNENVAAWVKDPVKLKPGSKMPNLNLSDADSKAVAAYLMGLK